LLVINNQLISKNARLNHTDNYEITFILNILSRILYIQENTLTPCGIYVISSQFAKPKYLLQISIHKKTYYDIQRLFQS
jgi:hypothetical protein